MNKQSTGTRFFIEEYGSGEPLFHGGIGNRDIEEVLRKEGWIALTLGDERNFGVGAKLRRWLRSRTLLKELPKGAAVLLQWPLHAKLHQRLVLNLVRLRTDVQVICFLTDINGLKDGNPALLREEFHFFKNISRFITHNETMTQWLRDTVPAAVVGEIGFFDFLASQNEMPRAFSNGICFAGNLAKSPFIQYLPQVDGIHFHLYGDRPGFLPAASNCTYYGQFAPADLPGILQGSFGLVWDGESADDHRGVFGDYARWISPHKLSLYILAGMPIICHAQSAAAKLVSKYGIGFSVNSLFEMKERLAHLSEDEFQAMRAAMKPLAQKISAGGCLKEALSQLSIR